MNWFLSLFRGARGTKVRRQRPGPRRARRRLAVEYLEDRCVPSTVTELAPLPTAHAAPTGLTRAPDGSLWFTERGANKVGRLAPNGTLTEYAVPTANSAPEQITAGPDGHVWFTERYGRKIGRVSQAGGPVAEFALPGYGEYPTAITTRPDGTVWFAADDAAATARLGTISPTGTATQLATGATRTAITGIVGGPDGNLWVTQVSAYWGDSVAKVSTAGWGSFTNYRLANRSAGPQGITAGPDGALWFTEANANQVARLTTAGVVTAFGLPPGSAPQQIVAGPDGALWFTEKGSNKIGRMATAGTLTEYALATASAQPLGIARGQDGCLYFTEQGGNRLGQVVV
jgi:virginiamycin B lyase